MLPRRTVLTARSRSVRVVTSLDRFDLNYPITLQDAENRHFSGRPSASFAFASASEVALIHLDHAAEQIGSVRGAGNDGCAYHVDGLQDRRITEPGLLSDPPSENSSSKSFITQSQFLYEMRSLLNPPSGKVMEGVAAPLATEPFVDYPVDFTASATCTKTMAVFPIQLCEEQPRGIL